LRRIRAGFDKRCGCGQCAHWVRIAAQRAGVSREQLEAVLAPAAKPQRRGSRAPREWLVRICDSSTIRVRGRDVDSQAGLAILLARLRHPR
jgi:hypothetical protein